MLRFSVSARALITRRLAVPLAADVLDEHGRVIGRTHYVDGLASGRPRYELHGAIYALDWRGTLALVQEGRKAA